MDERIGTNIPATRGPSLSPDVGKYPDCTLSNVVATPKAAAKPFEWVQYGDPAARKRARAHVTRGYRRQQAEAAHLAKTQAGFKSKSPSSSPVPQTSPAVAQKNIPSEDDKHDKAVVAVSQTHQRPKVAQWRQHFDPFALRPIKSGNTDPFFALPIELDASGHAILSHFFHGVKPISYDQDSRSDFNPVKQLSWDIALDEPAGLHSICAFSATDMAILSGQQDSQLVLRHRGLSLSLANKKIAVGDASDSAVIGVALLGGYELLFGTPRTFIMHWIGMEMLLRLRGGIEKIRESNQKLYDYIQWLDYTGHCVFMAPRKFAPTPSTVRLRTDPGDCLEELLNTLPNNYDLFESMSRTCLKIKYMIDLILKGGKGCGISENARAQLTNITSQSSTELAHLISITSVKGHKGRTQFIEQFLPTISMMIGVTCLNAGTKGISPLFARLASNLSDPQHVLLLQAFASLCDMVVDETAVPLTPFVLHDLVVNILHIGGPWDWEEWQSVDQALIDFFLADRGCAGTLQTRLRYQLGYDS